MKNLPKKQNNIKPKKNQHLFKKFAWLLEAIFRGYVGWIFLIDQQGMVTNIVAGYFLVSSAMIVIYHFLNSK